MSAFAELFKKADNFTITNVNVTRKTHHQGIVNQEGTGYETLVMSREVTINVTGNHGMVAYLNAEFCESWDNLDFAFIGRHNHDFSNGNGDIHLRLSTHSNEPIWVILKESDYEDDDITQFLETSESFKAPYATLFANNLLDALIQNDAAYTKIKKAFYASFY